MSKKFNFDGTLQENGKRVITEVVATASQVSASTTASATATTADGKTTINFKIPQGNIGPIGATGPTGPTAAVDSALSASSINTVQNKVIKAALDDKLSWNRGAYDINTLYDAQISMIASGSNLPCGSQYGVNLTLPYRNFSANKTPDFGAQIFLPNGDDTTKPNGMFYRTSLSGSWNPWQEVMTTTMFSFDSSTNTLNITIA